MVSMLCGCLARALVPCLPAVGRRLAATVTLRMLGRLAVVAVQGLVRALPRLPAAGRGLAQGLAATVMLCTRAIPLGEFGAVLLRPAEVVLVGRRLLGRLGAAAVQGLVRALSRLPAGGGSVRGGLAR
ncbi:hypothetical protein [Yinghuangia seranimata]|uniref:hypothetical protein n=1 Tax=Yinghuangia seranimata TaxID=408067 RepID=UPI00248B5D9F|nr:hypothetical protein [Yinghuangia seranimata]MDI2130265.1 hypothetical protein [Yinghuangia seranimata]